LAESKYAVQFFPGQLVMFAGAPNAGKTTLALIMAIRMGVKTLYISADSDEATMAARAASAVTQEPYLYVRDVQAHGAFDDLYGDAVSSLPIRFAFEPTEPSSEDVANAIHAYIEVWGEPPQLVIVDNLMNLETADNNEWQGMRRGVKDMHWLGRKIKACIWLLHHTSEQDDRWITSAPPRNAIQGKVSQLPEMIITLGNNQGELFLAVVKNRHGPSDPHAENPIRMIMDFSRNRLWDEPMMREVGSD